MVETSTFHQWDMVDCGVIGGGDGGSFLIGNTNQVSGSAEKGSAAALGGK